MEKIPKTKSCKFKDPFFNMISKPNKRPEIKPVYAPRSRLFESTSAHNLRKAQMTQPSNQYSQRSITNKLNPEILLISKSTSPQSLITHYPIKLKIKLPSLKKFQKKSPPSEPVHKSIEFRGTFGIQLTKN